MSSAGNSGSLLKGTSGTWEGDFLSAGAATGPLAGAGIVHNFGTPGSPQTYDPLTASATGTNVITLKWSDPAGASSNDYDFYILNSAGTTIKGAPPTFKTVRRIPTKRFSESIVRRLRRIIVRLLVIGWS